MNSTHEQLAKLYEAMGMEDGSVSLNSKWVGIRGPLFFEVRLYPRENQVVEYEVFFGTVRRNKAVIYAPVVAVLIFGGLYFEFSDSFYWKVFAFGMAASVILWELLRWLMSNNVVKQTGQKLAAQGFALHKFCEEHLE